MLEIVRYNEDEYDFPCLLVLGCFDGLHIGHAELLKKAKLQAKINGLDLGVMLFADGKGGKNLYSFEERVALLEQYNAKFVLKIDFNEEFKSIKPLEFLECLEDKLNVKAYMSGKDFRFGNGAKGKASTLKTYAEDEENGVWYMPVKDVTVDGEKVSTSNIKALVENGKVKEAATLLGRNYSVTGTVEKGAGRGAPVLGFPTVNILYPENRIEVKHGVYKVKCVVEGNEYEGIANFGSRPTFDDDGVVLEAYLKGYEGSLYEKSVKVEFVDYIRDIVKFSSAEELAAQLKKDSEFDGAEQPAESVQEAELAVADATETNNYRESEPEPEETAQEIEQANKEFDKELNEKVVVEEGELSEVTAQAKSPTEEEKLLENTPEEPEVEPVELEEVNAEDIEVFEAEEIIPEDVAAVRPEAVDAPEAVEEIEAAKEILPEPVEAEEITPEPAQEQTEEKDEVLGD